MKAFGWTAKWARVLLVGLGLWPNAAQEAEISAGRLVRIVSWNVENLFDCINNPTTDDDAFLPDSPRRWNKGRLRKKLTQISKTLVHFSDRHVPDLVALQEVEGDSVLKDLTERSPLRRIGYKYVVTHSLDRRGINVALLYRPEIFRVLNEDTLRFCERPTRDILCVTGRLQTGDTLCVIVCHLPSKLQGKAGNTFRWQIVDSLKTYVARLQESDPNLLITILGDMNSTPSDPMWTHRHSASQDGPEAMPLRNLSAEWAGRDGVGGTYKYDGAWQLLDQCFVSENFYERYTLRQDVLTGPNLLQRDKWGQPEPRRLYNGYKYQGGVSDHLPICLDIQTIEN